MSIPTKVRLMHWNAPAKSDTLDLTVDRYDDRINIDVQDDKDADTENEGIYRSVSLEVRDGGDLAVMCYNKDNDEPKTIILKADGSWEFSNGE